MLRHYFASRRQGGVNPLGVGTIALGSIYYIQDEAYWRDRWRSRPSLVNPRLVVAFLKGELHAAHRDPLSGRWLAIYMSNRTDFALVRSLRDGRRATIAIHILQPMPPIARRTRGWAPPITDPFSSSPASASQEPRHACLSNPLAPSCARHQHG